MLDCLPLVGRSVLIGWLVEHLKFAKIFFGCFLDRLPSVVRSVSLVGRRVAPVRVQKFFELVTCNHRLTDRREMRSTVRKFCFAHLSNLPNLQPPTHQPKGDEVDWRLNAFKNFASLACPTLPTCNNRPTDRSTGGRRDRQEIEKFFALLPCRTSQVVATSQPTTGR